MYVQLTVTSTDYIFQLKDEAGVDIGSPISYSISSYNLVYTASTVEVKVTANSRDQLPVGQYPLDRLII